MYRISSHCCRIFIRCQLSQLTLPKLPTLQPLPQFVYISSSKRIMVSTTDSLPLKMINDGASGKIESEDNKAVSKLKVKRLSEHAFVPTRGTKFAAGYDLYSAYDCVVPARGKAMVKTDISIAFPQGYYARVAPRSGLAWKNSIDVGAGVIDVDYRGNVGVILFNHGDNEFKIARGDRVAQLILERICTPDVIEVDELDETERNAGGFGSTGVSLSQSSKENDPNEANKRSKN